MKIAFEEHGEGFPVVLLHAFPLSRKMWSSQIEAITTENFRLILPDLRGFGETSSFADINSIEDMAKDVAELLDNLEIEQAIIGGLSMGGYVTFNLFRLNPERFKAIILCDTNCSADTEEKRENRYKLIEKIEEKGSQALIDKMLPNLIGEFTKQNNKGLVSELSRIFMETNPQAAIAALRGMAERRDHTDILGEIKVPTILIFGEADSITDVNTARQINEQIPFSNLSIIKNAGHYSNLEQPELFNSALTKFLKTIEI